MNNTDIFFGEIILVCHVKKTLIFNYVLNLVIHVGRTLLKRGAFNDCIIHVVGDRYM